MGSTRRGWGIRFEKQKEKYRILIMAVLLGICCALIYYFHAVVEVGTAFSHFFYVPIILALLWWRIKGLLVAIFSALFLIFTQFFIRLHVEAFTDLIQASMFIVVALVVAFLVEKSAKAEEERERLLKELEAKNAELERFTSTVSHDLRSPLITIEGFAGMLREDLERNEIEKVESNLKYIENAATTMDHLLKDTLELSRIGRVVNPPEDVPLEEIVEETLEQTSAKIKSSRVEVSVAGDFPVVLVDRRRIVETLVNLIENSINYMGEQPHPKIDIGFRTDGEETVFFVRDNGIGIDKSQHEKVFELFYTVDKSGKGTGAGLAIVKRIIEVHNGRVWIESEKGKGCTVCFTLPVV